MGDFLIIHSDQAGAPHHIPLTRADDAYIRGNNKLWVSDGTVKGGKDIYLYAGLCEYNLGNYQQAVDYLKRYKGKEPLMKARCLAGIADAYTGLEDYNEALNYYQKALAVTENLNEDFVNVFNATYMLKAGVACEEIGDKAKALEFYKTIKDRYPQSIEGYDIDKYISRIESQQ